MTSLQQFLDRLQTDFPDAYQYVWASVGQHKIEDYWVERYLGWYVGERFLAGERESLKPLLDRICELVLWIEQRILISSRANRYRVYSGGCIYEYVAGEDDFSACLLEKLKFEAEYATLKKELFDILPPLLVKGLESYYIKEQIQIDREASMW